MSDYPLVAIDCETTALHERREAWEVAVIRRDEHGDREHTWLLPVTLDDADPKSLEVGSFYERHPYGRYLAGGDPIRPPDTSSARWYWPDRNPDQAFREIGIMLHGARPVIGAVPSFDLECLLRPLLDAGCPPAWHHRIRCVETLTAGHLRRDVGGLGACAEALGIDHPDAHTALGDARTALRIWDVVMGGADA